MIFGTGFPPFRGGLCRWADQMPFRVRLAATEELGKTFGERFRFSDAYCFMMTEFHKKRPGTSVPGLVVTLISSTEKNIMAAGAIGQDGRIYNLAT